MMRHALSIALVFPFVPLGAQEPSTGACMSVAPDSVRFGNAPVFAACEVDRPAKLRRAAKPRATFPRDVRCLVATLEFVVDERGAPVVSTAVLLKRTTVAFGNTALRGLAEWRFDPAMRNQEPVRQLVVERLTVEDDRLPFVVLEPGASRPPPMPRPVCR